MIELNNRYFNRDLSWLSFNYRVLQEANNKANPLLERLKFLAIYSSNLDEFFRVRVASHKSLMKLKKKTRKKIAFKPKKLLSRINNVVLKQQEEFGAIYRNQIFPELNKNNIFIRDEKNLPTELKDEVLKYYYNIIKPIIKPTNLDEETPLFLENRMLYLLVQLENSNDKNNPLYSVIHIPTNRLSRFHSFNQKNGVVNICFLEDIIRLGLNDLFLEKVLSCYSIKLSRDAELYIEDEFSGDLVAKIRKNLTKRDTGLPSRLLYDHEMPKPILKMLAERLQMSEDDIMYGGHYHNFNDFFSFPNPNNVLPQYEKREALKNKDMETIKSYFPLLKQKDTLLYYPYHKYDYVIRFLKEVAKDEKVKDIKLTLYRIAKNSKIAKALLLAIQNGKTVTVFIEIKARFDEAANLHWAEQLEKAGAKVHYSIPGLKVHAKLCLVTRVERNRNRYSCYLSTGNFNEQSAKIYTDFGLFTGDESICKDVIKVFKQLSGNIKDQNYKQLIVAPNHMRKKFEALIDQEIRNIQQGKEAYMILKMNSLEDKAMIDKLYQASQAGVKINIILRGICCLVPGVKGLSENIKIKSIVGQYLEHARIFIFCADGEEKTFLASADWMTRNLSRRVEVAFPINDPQLKKQVRSIVDIQWKDNVKARRINISQSNPYYKTSSKKKINSQQLIYDILKPG